MVAAPLFDRRLVGVRWAFGWPRRGAGTTGAAPPRRRSPRPSQRLPQGPVNPSSAQWRACHFTVSSGCGGSSAGHTTPGASHQRNPSRIGQSPCRACLTLTAPDRARIGGSILAPAIKSRPFAASAGVRDAVCQFDGRELPRRLCQNAPQPVRAGGRAFGCAHIKAAFCGP